MVAWIDVLSRWSIQTSIQRESLLRFHFVASGGTSGIEQEVPAFLGHRTWKGQTKNVLVHKFVCRGTVEEKIDQLIDSKRQLSQELLEGGGELRLTELSDDDLLKLVALDLHVASME